MVWVGFSFGLLIVVLSTVSLVSTFVLPRGGSKVQALPLFVGRVVRRGLLLLARPARSFARKDGILAAVGPVSLIAQLAVFLGLYVLGYGLMQWHWTGTLTSGIAESGVDVVLGRAGAACKERQRHPRRLRRARPVPSPSLFRSATCPRSTRPSTAVSPSSP